GQDRLEESIPKSDADRQHDNAQDDQASPVGPGFGLLVHSNRMSKQQVARYDLRPTPMSVETLASAVRAEMAKAIAGQNAIVDQLLVAILADGHVLIEGVPGVAKTLMVRTLAR